MTVVQAMPPVASSMENMAVDGTKPFPKGDREIESATATASPSPSATPSTQSTIIHSCKICNKYETRSKSHLKTHMALVHNKGVVWHSCPEYGCEYMSKESSKLKRHAASIHNKGVVWHPCTEPQCDYKAKRKGTLKRHMAFRHDKGVVWNFCPEAGCTYKSKAKSSIKTHLECAHDKPQMRSRASSNASVHALRGLTEHTWVNSVPEEDEAESVDGSGSTSPESNGKQSDATEDTWNQPIDFVVEQLQLLQHQAPTPTPSAPAATPCEQPPASHQQQQVPMAARPPPPAPGQLLHQSSFQHPQMMTPMAGPHCSSPIPSVASPTVQPVKYVQSVPSGMGYPAYGPPHPQYVQMMVPQPQPQPYPAMYTYQTVQQAPPMPVYASMPRAA